MNTTDFVRGYIECALWSSNDEGDESGGEPLDKNYTRDDIDPDTFVRMVADCAAFMDQNQGALCGAVRHSKQGISSARLGHDFWLTRNGHGAGFWDGDIPEPYATQLTDASKKFGEFYLYVGDDGKVHGS